MLVGKRTRARRIAKFIGSLGEIGEPPEEYVIHLAAKQLDMSYADLESHPDFHRLMEVGLTLRSGINDGEYARELNPVYQQKVKAAVEQIQKAKQ